VALIAWHKVTLGLRSINKSADSPAPASTPTGTLEEEGLELSASR
jgi:hypothetical protein